MLVASLALTAPAAHAGDQAGEVGREGGLGAAAALSTLIYGPVKLVYATGGLIVGSFAWIFTAGDSEVAGTVFTRSLRGTYVITPEILLGEQKLAFIGQDAGEAPRTENVASARSSAAPDTSYDGAYGGDATYGGSSEDRSYDELGW